MDLVTNEALAYPHYVQQSQCRARESRKFTAEAHVFRLTLGGGGNNGKPPPELVLFAGAAEPRRSVVALVLVVVLLVALPGMLDLRL